MPVEWRRKSWGPGREGWPTFGVDGKVVKEVKDEQQEEERDDERQ